jgi:hypothetical protein
MLFLRYLTQFLSQNAQAEVTRANNVRSVHALDQTAAILCFLSLYRNASRPTRSSLAAWD